MLSSEEREIEAAWEELCQYADLICREIWEMDLPPFHAINHTVPLINESKIYSWRPYKCSEKFRDQWAENRDAYLKSGHWEITALGNTVPMILIPKLNTNLPELRTVVDLQEGNKNMHWWPCLCQTWRECLGKLPNINTDRCWTWKMLTSSSVWSQSMSPGLQLPLQTVI